MASINLYTPLFNATLRLLAAAVPLATAPGSHVDPAAVSASQAQLVPDVRTLRWWQQVAGQLALHVNWETFALAFHRSLEPPTPLSANDTAILRYMLDPFDSGFVAAWRYADLSRAFGNQQAIMTRLRELASLRAFIGYASSTEADRVLNYEPTCTLLVRASRGRPSQLALASKDGWGKVAHTVVTVTPTEMRVADRSYGTFVAMITDLRLGQGQPPLLHEPSFYGELLAARADDMLSGKPLGTYLWRYSSRPQFLALSFVAKENGAAQHITVEQTAAATFKLEEHTHIYSNLSELIAALAPHHKLQAPLMHSMWFPFLPVSAAPSVEANFVSGQLQPNRGSGTGHAPLSPGRRPTPVLASTRAGTCA